MLDKLESWTQEKIFPYGDLDFWNFVPKSIGSSVSENFANFWCFQKTRLKGFLLENWPRKPTWASLARSALEPPWASLARSVPKPSPPRTQPGLVLHVLCQSRHPREPRSSRQRPPPPESPKRSAGCEKKWKVKVMKWIHFWSLFFLKLIYIIDHVYA